MTLEMIFFFLKERQDLEAGEEGRMHERGGEVAEKHGETENSASEVGSGTELVIAETSNVF